MIGEQKKVQLTSLCYLERDGKYLMLLRNKKKKDANKGKWIGVGGKFLPGETPDACMLREVWEETGLKLTEYRFHGVISFISDVWDDEYMFLYTASEWEGEPDPDCPEGELKWIPKEEVLKLNLWEGDKVFLKLLLEGREHLDLKLSYEGEKLVLAELTGSGRWVPGQEEPCF